MNTQTKTRLRTNAGRKAQSFEKIAKQYISQNMQIRINNEFSTKSGTVVELVAVKYDQPMAIGAYHISVHRHIRQDYPDIKDMLVQLGEKAQQYYDGMLHHKPELMPDGEGGMHLNF